jgi:hypothetical protein
LEFNFNDINDHVLLNRLILDESRRLFESPMANLDNSDFYKKFINVTQGKAAELYLVENTKLEFLTEDNVKTLYNHRYYQNIVDKLLYHDLVYDGSVFEVKAYSKNIKSNVTKVLDTIRLRKFNFSDYLILFEVKDWNYRLIDKIKI